MSDIIFVNGYIGIQCEQFTQYISEISDIFTGGNQQFTTRGFGFVNTNIAIWMLWDWGWTCKFSNQVSLDDCLPASKGNPSHVQVATMASTSNRLLWEAQSTSSTLVSATHSLPL
jgi:hypothetical protein